MSKDAQDAFPSAIWDTEGNLQKTDGMSKRFYAACAAMQGIISTKTSVYNYYGESLATHIKLAYKYADALIEQEGKNA